jgi:4-hydroxy-3-methylbut-2-en-1-yl diphosphate synthase IspG/GcpE
VLTSPIELSGTPADGAVKQALATGNLSMHGITRAVRIAVSAERTGSSIYVLTDIPIAFADWHISLPDTGGLYGIKSPGTLEVLLHLTRSAGLTQD